MDTRMKHRLGTVSLIVAASIWGGSVVAQKVALQTWHPNFVLFIRGAGTLLLILPYLWLRNQIQFSLIFKDKVSLTWMSLSGLANSLFVLLGLQYTSAAEAGMIMGSSPILMALLLKRLGRRSLDGSGWAAALMTFLGVILVVFHPETGEEKIKMVWLGDLFVFLGVVCWTIYTLLSKEAMTRHPPFLIMALTWVGVVFVAPLAFNRHGSNGGNLILGWSALIYIVLVATVLAFFLWLYGLHQIGAAHSTIFLNLIPLSAILFSAVLLGETIHWRQWAGGALILSGAWIISVTAPRKEG